MKKIYFAPTVKAIRIETTSMIAVSGPQAGGETNKIDDLLGRDNDYDFDEDEE